MGSTVFEIQISDMERVFVDTADIILVDSSTVLVESFDTSSDFGVISCFVAISYTSVTLSDSVLQPTIKVQKHEPAWGAWHQTGQGTTANPTTLHHGAGEASSSASHASLDKHTSILQFGFHQGPLIMPIVSIACLSLELHLRGAFS